MGAMLSFLRNTYYGLHGLLSVIAESNLAFEQVLARINAPQLPHPHPTVSFWQQHPIYPALVNMRSDPLPGTADIVIIGSGISGASIAHTILHECQVGNKSRKVMILEGREVCSGATGRNGGHVKVAMVVEYGKLKNRFGARSARKIVELMLMTKSLLRTVAEVEGLEEGEVRDVRTVDAFTDLKILREVTAMLDVLKEDWPELAATVNVLDAKEIQERFGFNEHFLGGMTYPSGAMWPYRLVTAIYDILLKEFPENFSIETSTMVRSITTTDEPKTPFLLHTSRGNIKCNQIIHATDAFAANLVPGLVGHIFPVRGHMSAQRPAKEFLHSDGTVSWSIAGVKDFEYITQRPGVPDGDEHGLGGEIMLGGGTIHSPQNGFDEFGQWGDDKLCHSIVCYLTGLLPSSFASRVWGGRESSVKAVWSGSMGFTTDMMPFVGRLPSKLTRRPLENMKPNVHDGSDVPGPSEWISAGFNGSGMVLGWLSGVAVGLKVLGRDKENAEEQYWKPKGAVEDWLPEQFICNPERVARASIYKLPDLL